MMINDKTIGGRIQQGEGGVFLCVYIKYIKITSSFGDDLQTSFHQIF